MVETDGSPIWKVYVVPKMNAYVLTELVPLEEVRLKVEIYRKLQVAGNSVTTEVYLLDGLTADDMMGKLMSYYIKEE